MINQTDLPDSITKPIISRPGYSMGFTRPLAERIDSGAAPPENRENIQSVYVVARPFRFLSGRVFVDGTAVSVVGANVHRRYLALQNTGGVSIFLGFGVYPDLSGNNSIELPAGSSMIFENNICPNNDVFAVASALCSLGILEGSIDETVG